MDAGIDCEAGLGSILAGGFAVRDSNQEERNNNQEMTEEKETKSGRRKKWMLVAGTILVIAAVFTCISWNSMHPSKTVTMKGTGRLCQPRTDQSN